MSGNQALADRNREQCGGLSTRIWHNPQAVSHQTLIIHNNQIYVGHGKDDVVEFETHLRDEETPTHLLPGWMLTIPKSSLVSVTSIETSNEITINYRDRGRLCSAKVDLATKHDRDSALLVLRRILDLAMTSDRVSRLNAALDPTVTLAIVGLATFLLSRGSTDSADIFVVGVAAAFFSVLWLLRRLANPPLRSTLMPVT